MDPIIREQKTVWILAPIKVQYWTDTREVGCAHWTTLDECTNCLEECFFYGGEFETKEEAWNFLIKRK